MKRADALFLALVVMAFAFSGCQRSPEETDTLGGTGAQLIPTAVAGAQRSIEFALQTGIVDGRMVFVGSGGDIDGVPNPDLIVAPGAIVSVTLTNGDGMPHDLMIPELGVQSETTSVKGESISVKFTADAGSAGAHAYFCSISGHRQAGMEGRLIVASP